MASRFVRGFPSVSNGINAKLGTVAAAGVAAAMISSSEASSEPTLKYWNGRGLMEVEIICDISLRIGSHFVHAFSIMFDSDSSHHVCAHW
jgi:hypothetical protein